METLPEVRVCQCRGLGSCSHHPPLVFIVSDGLCSYIKRLRGRLGSGTKVLMSDLSQSAAMLSHRNLLTEDLLTQRQDIKVPFG